MPKAIREETLEADRPPGADARRQRPRPPRCATTSSGSPPCRGARCSRDRLDLKRARAGPRRRPLRPREGQGADPRVPRRAQAPKHRQGPDPVLRRPARAWARPRSASRSPGRSAASSCACRSAACATRPRSAATAAPTSAPCPGASSRGSTRPAPSNPVFMLDEVDKIGSRLPRRPVVGPARGARPGAEPRLPRPLPGRPFDLSHVLFIATANLLDPIQPALPRPHGGDPARGLHRGGEARDRRRHLLPRQIARERPRRRAARASATRRSAAVIRGYTREAGLRNLERELGALCRKVAREVAEGAAPADADRVADLAALPRPAAGPAPTSCSSATGSASPRGSPGPRPAARCCSSRRWSCGARAS